MARTDYGAILSTVIKDTSDAVREVNGTSSLIAPNQWGTAIRTMHSDSDYENALEQMIEETASGDIASFSDGANNIPCPSVLCTINPVQDLHGQDYPYPSGGGKNKMPPIPSPFPANGTELVDYGRDITFTGYAIQMIFSGSFANVGASFIIGKDSNDTSTVTLVPGYFKDHNGNTLTANTTYTNEKCTFTLNSTVNVRKFIWYTYPSFSNASITDIQFENGNTVTPYAPYSNICPITGHTELNLVHTGKNLFEVKPFSDWTSVGSYKALKKCLPANQSMVMSFSDKDTTIDISDVYFGFLTSSWSGGGGTAPSTSDYRWCLSAGVISSNTSNRSVSGGNLLDSVFIYPNTETAYNKLFARYNIQIELGSSATAYEPYTGSTTTTDLGTTVYGGTLDPVSGVLTIDRVVVNMSNLNWSFITDRGWSTTDLIGVAVLDYNNPSFIAEQWRTHGWTGRTNGDIVCNSGGAIFCVTTDSVNQPQGNLCYELATPTTTQLTPQEVKSLLGSNNIYHDCNGQVAVTYKANGQLYVEQHQPEPEE